MYFWTSGSNGRKPKWDDDVLFSLCVGLAGFFPLHPMTITEAERRIEAAQQREAQTEESLVEGQQKQPEVWASQPGTACDRPVPKEVNSYLQRELIHLFPDLLGDRMNHEYEADASCNSKGSSCASLEYPDCQLFVFTALCDLIKVLQYYLAGLSCRLFCCSIRTSVDYTRTVCGEI